MHKPHRSLKSQFEEESDYETVQDLALWLVVALRVRALLLQASPRVIRLSSSGKRSRLLLSITSTIQYQTKWKSNGGKSSNERKPEQEDSGNG